MMMMTTMMMMMMEPNKSDCAGDLICDVHLVAIVMFLNVMCITSVEPNRIIYPGDLTL